MSKSIKIKLFATSATIAVVLFGFFLAFFTAHGQEKIQLVKNDDIREPAPQIRSDELLIPQVLQRLDSFKFMSMAIRETGLEELLSHEGPFTVFAPSDEAFVKLPFSTIQGFENNQEEIKKVISYHIATKRLVSTDFLQGDQFASYQGQNLQISDDMGGLKINDATFIFKNIETSNGIIHVIDTVLFPKNKE